MESLPQFIEGFALIALLAYVAWWAYEHRLKPAKGRQSASQWLDSEHKWQVKQFIDKLYQYVNAKSIANLVRRQMGGDTDQWVYGEIDFIGFGELMALIDPKPGETFVDCGSGAGKAVFTMALLYPDVHCIGLELMAPLYQLSAQQFELFDRQLQAHDTLPYRYNIQFLHQDMLQFDYSECTIVWLNATCFSQAFIATLTQQLEAMPVGARVLITSQGIVSPQFQLSQTRQVVMSWGMVRCFLYQKIQ